MVSRAVAASSHHPPDDIPYDGCDEDYGPANQVRGGVSARSGREQGYYTQDYDEMIVRLMAERDIPIATVLLGQLGYEMSEAETARRLAIVLRDDDHRAWVAEKDGCIVGLLHAFFRPALEKPPEVIVQALVIEAASRSRGSGEMLMGVAEQWSREIGSPSISLYSGLQRADAHRFYERLGYREAGTAHLLRKR